MLVINTAQIKQVNIKTTVILFECYHMKFDESKHSFLSPPLYTMSLLLHSQYSKLTMKLVLIELDIYFIYFENLNLLVSQYKPTTLSILIFHDASYVI